MLNDILSKYDFSSEDVQVKKFGKVKVLEFDVCYNMKFIVMLDYITNYYSYICYDTCNGGHYKATNTDEWEVLKSLGSASLPHMLESLDNYLSRLI